MSEPVDGTRGKPPEEVEALSSALRQVLAAGKSVPGLSSWVLERRLGGGGFGEVWLTKHAWNAKKKPRAVKFCTDPAARHRLVTHEQNVVRRVMKYAGDHPNIVPLLECNLDGDIPWLMYEFVKGGTLAEAVLGWKELPLPRRFGRAVRTLHAIAGALASCHKLDPPIVHRDLKPLNVLMAGAVPRVTDFGLSAAMIAPPVGDELGKQSGHSARLPSNLKGYGTDGYSPPQQRLGAPPDPRDDVYALGIMAYQLLLCDVRKFPDAWTSDDLRKLKVPADLILLIMNSVADDHERRYKDASEWERQLGELLPTRSESVSVVPPPAPPPVIVRPPLPSVVLRPRDTREIEIAPRVTMTFCWVPKGECQLGSPKDEQDYVTKTFFEGKRPDWLDSETETARGKFKTDGFWMGKHTVTQAEWKAVMGDNPSFFNGTKDNKAKGMDTSRFPVETVSWDRICGEGKYAGEGFLNKIDHGGIQKALGKAGKFKLPTENQWEYAARVGRGNAQPFYWGKELNGTQANCNGNYPYGTTTEGPYLGRTCAVDFTNDGKHAPHPWGLMHMHGNVYQWCEDYYDQTNMRRVLRGGSWCDYALLPRGVPERRRAGRRQRLRRVPSGCPWSSMIICSFTLLYFASLSSPLLAKRVAKKIEIRSNDCCSIR